MLWQYVAVRGRGAAAGQGAGEAREHRNKARHRLAGLYGEMGYRKAASLDAAFRYLFVIE
jgi:hypothetical protein